MIDSTTPMVRYHRNQRGTPTATLVTSRVGELIYFGVTRCSKKDTFNKQFGRTIATNRMLKEFEEASLEGVSEKDLNGIVVFAENKMRGVCSVNDVTNLLDWFHNSERERVS